MRKSRRCKPCPCAPRRRRNAKPRRARPATAKTCAISKFQGRHYKELSGREKQAVNRFCKKIHECSRKSAQSSSFGRGACTKAVKLARALPRKSAALRRFVNSR